MKAFTGSVEEFKSLIAKGLLPAMMMVLNLTSILALTRAPSSVSSEQLHINVPPCLHRNHPTVGMLLHTIPFLLLIATLAITLTLTLALTLMLSIAGRRLCPSEM